jgi:hypothetical protein
MSRLLRGVSAVFMTGALLTGCESLSRNLRGAFDARHAIQKSYPRENVGVVLGRDFLSIRLINSDLMSLPKRDRDHQALKIAHLAYNSLVSPDHLRSVTVAFVTSRQVLGILSFSDVTDADRFDADDLARIDAGVTRKALLALRDLQPAAYRPIDRNTVVHAILDYEMDRELPPPADQYSMSVMFQAKDGSTFSNFDSLHEGAVTEAGGTYDLVYPLARVMDDPKLAHPVTMYVYLTKRTVGEHSEVIAETDAIRYVRDQAGHVDKLGRHDAARPE